MLPPINNEAPPMIVFNVNDMTCSHCSGAITKAVLSFDPAATVRIDLSAHRVEIQPAAADAAGLAAVIADAGYTPTLVLASA